MAVALSRARSMRKERPTRYCFPNQADNTIISRIILTLQHHQSLDSGNFDRSLQAKPHNNRFRYPALLPCCIDVIITADDDATVYAGGNLRCSTYHMNTAFLDIKTSKAVFGHCVQNRSLPTTVRSQAALLCSLQCNDLHLESEYAPDPPTCRFSFCRLLQPGRTLEVKRSSQAM